MKTQHVPPVIQAVGLACVPVADMPPGTALARKLVAAAIIAIVEREDGLRDVVVTCVSDARQFEWPLTVLIENALVAGASAIITESDRTVLAVEAACRRFFAEPKLSMLAAGKGALDPTALLGATGDEAALCRRLGIPISLASDSDVAQWWSRDAPTAVEDVALTVAVSRMVLWAHGASFRDAIPDAFFETLLPLRERLFDLEANRPGLKSMLASRPFHRAASFASDYREYRAKRDAGCADARWVTFEDGL